MHAQQHIHNGINRITLSDDAKKLWTRNQDVFYAFVALYPQSEYAARENKAVS